MRNKDKPAVSFEEMNLIYLQAKNLEAEYNKTYNSWRGMRERCNNPKHVYFEYYGGKGVKVCERWSSFKNFLSDMGIRPEGFFLDRIDGGKGYSPENCRWVPVTISAVNRTMKKNKTGYRGVFRRRSGRFAAVVKKEGRAYVVGTYDTAEEAAVAYNDKATELYGSEAKLNEV